MLVTIERAEKYVIQSEDSSSYYYTGDGFSSGFENAMLFNDNKAFKQLFKELSEHSRIIKKQVRVDICLY